MFTRTIPLLFAVALTSMGAGCQRNRWLIPQGAVATIQANSAANAAVIGTSPIILETNASGPYASPAPTNWNAVYLVREGSEASLEADIAGYPSWVTIVMYDNEPNASPATPASELLDPPTYVMKAAHLVHASGRLFFSTASLCAAPCNYSGGANAEHAALYATSTVFDGYSIQTQAANDDAVEFLANMNNSVNGVTAKNPNMGTFTVGISNCPKASALTAAQIEAVLVQVPGQYAVWGNFGAHASCGTPVAYDVFAQIIADMTTMTRP